MGSPSRLTRAALILVLICLAATACRATAQVSFTETASGGRAQTGPEAADSATGSTLDGSSSRIQDDANPFSDPIAGGGVDFRLTRDDVACGDEDLNIYPSADFLTVHVVVDGNLGAACFGEPDARLTRAWQILASITPAGQLHDLGLFGGFVSNERGETTLAFVNRLDFEGSVFQMSVNLDEAEADPDELMLTMAHEFSHVFTALSTQIDRFGFPQDCETWDNGEGCYLEDSLIWEWIETFWGDELVSQVDPFESPTGALGDQRCSVNPGFLGSYAASHPEEDFAETFSAFVFQLDVDTPQLREKMKWFASQPGLAEFRNLAVEAGLGPLPNHFPRCG